MSDSPHTARERAWIELAELFRDTEMTEDQPLPLARRLRDEGLDADNAEFIKLDEVMPAFGWNLLSVAGDWTGWPDAVVVETITDWLSRRNSPTLAGQWHRSPPAGLFQPHQDDMAKGHFSPGGNLNQPGRPVPAR